MVLVLVLVPDVSLLQAWLRSGSGRWTCRCQCCPQWTPQRDGCSASQLRLPEGESMLRIKTSYRSTVESLFYVFKKYDFRIKMCITISMKII